MKIKKAIALMIGLVLIVSLALPGTLAVSVDQAAASSSLTVADGTELKVSPETVILQKSDDQKLTADAGTLLGTYQWQIQASEGVWVNILGANEKTLTVNYGLVASLLSGGTAKIRCHMTTDAGKALDSNVVTVQIQPDAAKAPAKAPAMSPAIGTVTMEAKALGDPVIIPAQTAAPAADQPPADEQTQADDQPQADDTVQPEAAPQDDANNDTPTPTTYVIQIVYQFQNGGQAANPWTATVGAGSDFKATIESPTVVGYAPEEGKEKVNIDITNISENKTIIVTYYPTTVNFTVKHYQQNVSDDKYTLIDTETKDGVTENPVGDKLAKSYEGFYALLYDGTPTIAADGSTVVEIYYDRYYYLMNFDLDGGYGVEPIYARYGTTISVADPEKPGYTFKGWTPSLPTTMPAENKTFTATWETGKSGFTVVFWYENANDDGYSVAGTYKPNDVAPGTTVSSDTYKNQSFTGRDTQHFTYNTNKAETVTVSGDGSTVLNVYFTRNKYTLIFKGGQMTLTCTRTEHEHGDSCCKYGGTGIGHWSHRNSCCKLGLSAHTHDSGCYKTSDLTITAKFQADIRGNFPIKEGNKTIWWNVPNGCKSFKPGTQLGSIDAMPGENITFTRDSAQSGAVIWYYIETLNGENGTYTHGGKNFKLYKRIDIQKSGYLTYTEEFHDIAGFTQWWSDPAFSSMAQGGRTSGINDNNYLCYTRNSYNLQFYNYNALISGKGGSVQYEAPLSSYDFVPNYPDNLEENAYVFAGWYTTPECFAGSEADLNNMTMPASDMILYAKWVPKTHTVRTYLTEDAMKSDPEDTLDKWEEVPHGTAVENPPEDPVNGNYTFVGWFYKENGVEKAFKFTMPVNRDLDVYAKWNSNTLVTYTIRYAIDNGDGTLTYIAKDTTGSALAGTTKTFDAKTGTELNVGYQKGYFPKTSSHSINMNIDGGNEFTFIYVPKDKVKYTVRYLDKATGEPVVVDGVATANKNEETTDAVVTETFKQIKGYAPDAYQKRLVLSADEKENVIIFWYTKDDKHAPVQVIHWIQNIAGEDYTEYQNSTNLNGEIGKEYSENLLTIPGFTYNTDKSKASGTLTEAGLVLNLYYDRIEYPYEFRFLEQGTDTKLAEPVTGRGRYQARVTEQAKSIPGYTLVGSNNQLIDIAIEDHTDVANKNVKTFYYTEQTVEIKYVVVGPDGCGTLDNYQESQLKVMTGEVKGSTPKANPGFKFVGWYLNKDCIMDVAGKIPNAVNPTTNKLTPQKRQNDGCHYEWTYYAKFEYDVADLTITKSGCMDIDENQSFIFEVTGDNGYTGKVVIKGNTSVTIKGLKIGKYTVKEVTDWSWRYTPNGGDTQTIELKPTGNTVTFTNDRVKNKWLGGDAYAKNIFDYLTRSN